MTTSVPSTTVMDDIADGEEVEGAVKKTLGIGFWVAMAWIGVISVAALLAPWLPIADPNEIANGAPRDGILGDNFMGTDALGRDVFARTIWGARISLGVGFLGIILGVVVGGALGIAAGYFKGLADQVISFLMFSLLSFPALVLALLITASLSRSFWTVAMTLGIIGIAPISRLARATTIQFAEREFVQAARVVGAKNGRIIIRF
ncbi:MAG: ABC transporter permease [Actinomycetota bacterium]